MKPLIIAGSIGSGKTTLCRGINQLEPEGYCRYISMDRYVRYLYEHDPSVQRALVLQFNTMERERISKRIFSSLAPRERLLMLQQLDTIFRDHLVNYLYNAVLVQAYTQRVLIECPLIFMLLQDWRVAQLRDKFMLVYLDAPEDMSKRRAVERDAVEQRIVDRKAEVMSEYVDPRLCDHVVRDASMFADGEIAKTALRNYVLSLWSIS